MTKTDRLKLANNRNTAARLALDDRTDGETVKQMIAVAISGRKAIKESQRQQTPKP